MCILYNACNDFNCMFDIMGKPNWHQTTTYHTAYIACDLS